MISLSLSLPLSLSLSLSLTHTHSQTDARARARAHTHTVSHTHDTRTHTHILTLPPPSLSLSLSLTHSLTLNIFILFKWHDASKYSQCTQMILFTWPQAVRINDSADIVSQDYFTWPLSVRQSIIETSREIRLLSINNWQNQTTAVTVWKRLLWLFHWVCAFGMRSKLLRKLG